MFASKLQIRLPRRITAYFLLFGLAALVWLSVGAVYVAHSVTDSRSESASLRSLGRGSDRVVLGYLRDKTADLQPILAEIRAQSGADYCAIVSPTGEYLAHSNRRVDGQAGDRAGRHDRSLGRGRARRISWTTTACRFTNTGRPLEGGRHDHRHAATGNCPAERVELRSRRGAVLAAGIHRSGLLHGGRRRAAQPAGAAGGRHRAAARPGGDEPVGGKLRAARSARHRRGRAIGWNRVVQQRLRGPQSDSLQQRIRQSLEQGRQSRLDAVLNSIPDGVATTDADGRLTYTNLPMSVILGLEGRGRASAATRERTEELPGHDRAA